MGKNKPNEPKHTLKAPYKGMITDGASLKQGYKVVSPQGRSPQAQSVVNPKGK